ncbi:MAG TPA: S41 family peptidase [Thermoanaerobaculia bacterium]
MRKVMIALLLLCSSAAHAFDRSAWLRDYAALKRTLEQRYSNLAWFASPAGGVDLPALDRRTLAALRAASSDDDAREAILSFVRAFHDGHFSQLTAQEPAPAAKSVPPPPADYSRQDAATGCAALNYAPFDLPQFSLPFESLPQFRLLADGITTPFRAGIVRGIGIVRIPSFEEAADYGSCLKAWQRDEIWDADGKLIRAKLREIVERGWYETLAALLRTFKAEGAEAVLVDVGNNSGGDDSGDIAARLFTDKPLHSASLWMSQDAAASGGYYDEQLEALRTAQAFDPSSVLVREALASFSNHKAQLQNEVCAMQWVWRERRNWSGNACRRLIAAGSAGGPLDYLDNIAHSEIARTLHWPSRVRSLWGTWSGPLYVLTDGRTYSAAEMFAAVLQNNRAATIVGVRTGGDGCGFMSNPGPAILPHSRLRFRIPNCVRLRADGTDEVAGVRPDIAILPTEGENSRARATRVLEAVRGSIARK